MGFFLLAPKVRAEDEVIALTLGAVSAGFAIPGIITAAGNAHYLRLGQKPSSGWRTGGFVMGGINVAVGGVFLGLVAPQGFGQVYMPAVGFGLFNATVGIVDIVMSGIATAAPDSRVARIHVVPVVFEDVRAKAVPGIAFRMGTF
jgi:hypothetical protein